MSTRATLRTKIRDNLDDTSTDTTKQAWLDARLNRQIEESRQYVAQLLRTHDKDRFFKTSQSLNLTSGTQSYALSADFLFADRVERVKSNNVALTDPVPIDPIPWSDLRNHDGESYRSRLLGYGGTERWVVRDGVIWFAPKPTITETAAITVYYTKLLTAFSDDVADSGIPTDLEPLVSHHATWVSLLQKGDQAASAWKAVFDDAWRTARSSLGFGQQIQEPRGVRTVS